MNKAHPLAPIHAYQLDAPSPYELSDGKLVACAPATIEHADAVLAGAIAIGTDPTAIKPMINCGYSPDPTILRAPDISVGRFIGGSGWVQGSPELAIRYVEPTQDAEDLARFIFEMLTAGTRWVWVVRLGGPRRVDVYSFAIVKRSYTSGQSIEAPGVLKNPVRVDALYMRELATDAAFTNLTQRRGFNDLQAMLAYSDKIGSMRAKRAGRRDGLREAIRLLFDARGWTLSEAQDAAITHVDDREKLRDWMRAAAAACSPAALRFE